MSIGTEASAAPDWLPDWADVSKYPEPEKATPRVWAWEFLRRNPEYQKVWEQLAKLPSGFIRHDFAADDIRQRLENEFGIRVPAAPSMNSSDPDFQRLPVFVRQVKTWMKPMGLPDDSEPYVVEAKVLEAGEVIIQFDLRWRLEDQLEAAKTFLSDQALQLHELGIIDAADRRLKFKYFRDHLRILDAKSQGEPHNEISKQIYGLEDKYPDNTAQQKVSDSLKRAKWFRDTGYRFIAMTIQA
jgi:hypothetical protein